MYDLLFWFRFFCLGMGESERGSGLSSSYLVGDDEVSAAYKKASVILIL